DHHQLAAAAETVALHGGDDRLPHRPRCELEPRVVGQRLVPGQRVALARGARRVGRDVVARGEAAPLGAQHDHARGRIAIGLVEAVDQQLLQPGADGVQLVGPIQRDNADAAVGGVGDDRVAHRLLQSWAEASRAPSVSAASLAQTISGSTWGFERAKVPKPQSDPAMTRSRPTTSAYRTIRCATSSGCSMKFVVESRTPGIKILSSGSFISRNTAHSCSWRGLAPSSEIAVARAPSTIGRMSRRGMSRWCGPS